jgi:lipid II:glycine glycyltransferase (peptidoglycan interpeptide bridge formation enzyme)
MGLVPTKEDVELLRLEGIKNSAIGIRMEPNVQVTQLHTLPVGQLVQGRHLFKPKTYWLNLTKSEEELMAVMSPKTRYNIRLAQKHEVRISEGVGIQDYLRLMFGKTTKRQGIYSHSEKYHQELARCEFVQMFSATYRDHVIAAWMIFTWKDWVYYAYGAFDDQYKAVMAPVLGLWEIIKWAKRNGYKGLDLWGAEEGRGFSRFKEQFGPEMVEMVGTYDLPINKIGYIFFRIAEEARWKMLRMLK